MMFWKKQHEHKLEVVAAQHQFFKATEGLVQNPGGWYTVVLLRCSCGDVATKTLPGRWTVDALRGVSNTDVAEVLMQGSVTA